MRLVSWNCCGAFRRKFSTLADLQADVLIVQECENPAAVQDCAYRDWAGDRYLWIGENKSKGLGVFPRTGTSVEFAEPMPGQVRYFLPFHLDGIPICAVWAHRDPSGPFDYIGQVWKFLQSAPKGLNDPKFILVGDFNSNRIWDKKRLWNHSAVVDALAKSGLQSAYHAISAEQQGAESQPTFYLQRNRSKPYHIDYAFVGNGWAVDAVTVGAPEDWLPHSDHVPLVLDIRPA